MLKYWDLISQQYRGLLRGQNRVALASPDPYTFYTYTPMGTRPRIRAAEIERFIVERKPGPENKEPWAGKRDPTHSNYDPNYIPPHRQKNK